MNRRLVTPVIVLVSFAAAFGIMSWRAGLWRAAPVDKATEAATSTPAPLPAAVTPPSGAAPASEANEPAQQQAAAAPPEPEPVPTDAFLAAQDRAAAHSSRSH